MALQSALMRTTYPFRDSGLQLGLKGHERQSTEGDREN
jgi:hypothetical protein